MEQGLLKNAPAENAFVLRNGRVLKNLHELANALVSMDDETFAHHVSKERNDFANWIQGVFQDEKLAKQVSKIRNREGIRNRLSDALREQAKQQAATVQKVDAQKQAPLKKQFFQKLLEKRKQKAAQNAQVPAPQPSSSPRPVQQEQKTSEQLSEMQRKLSEVLSKEKEIEFKERKLLEIEQKIERKLLGPSEHHFFTREFVQGIVTGFLVTLIIVLMYAKFVLQV